MKEYHYKAPKNCDCEVCKQKRIEEARKHTPRERGIITAKLAKLLEKAIINIPDAKLSKPELNTKRDKCDYSLTYNKEHFWIVLLCEPKAPKN